ncbi:MAG: hypothetical protein COS14_03965 [Bacteroidetes bacterium CG02_land_8_20_14_3_00_31_25]|nr:hypothetical protein [Bacteroidota bacterium]PIV61794.1 MAG: hypothetical protein COS14_03965 [Bacteroidetes bacterium CG02_land_8_20_14_3_00_31_25]PIX35182.1 MAG: hypothetical protein COZ59_06820 [Bacteroidetes bacterium CG_4_8_14_3_um_filter_31_14]
MEIYCIEDFKVEYEKLISKKSYSSLNQDIIDYFFGKPFQELCSGTRLNNNDETPYIKKRLGGRGGFRVYFLLILKGERLYLMFVHPKTGSMGSENINDESKTYLYKKVLSCIKFGNLYKVEINVTNNTLVYKREQKH